MEAQINAAPVVALLEDDDQVRFAVTALLGSKGIETVAAAAGAELAGMIIARGVRPALLIADYRLGSATALEEVPAVLPALAPDARVIVTTGDTSPATRDLIEGNGWGLLIKPYKPQELLGLVAESRVAAEGAVGLA